MVLKVLAQLSFYCGDPLLISSALKTACHRGTEETEAHSIRSYLSLGGKDRLDSSSHNSNPSITLVSMFGCWLLRVSCHLKSLEISKASMQYQRDTYAFLEQCREIKNDVVRHTKHIYRQNNVHMLHFVQVLWVICSL